MKKKLQLFIYVVSLCFFLCSLEAPCPTEKLKNNPDIISWFITSEKKAVTVIL